MSTTTRKPVFDLIISRGGHTAETTLPDDCRFFEACGLIERCEVTDVPLRESVRYPRGARWGSGEYLREQQGRAYAKVYRLTKGYNHGHLELAARERYERERQMTRADIASRVDAVLAGRDPSS